jgi:ribosomal-protein-alanine N-acetyltransferase
MINYPIQSKATNIEIIEMVVGDLDEIMAIECSSFVTPWSAEMFEQGLRLPEFRNLVAKVMVEGRREIAGYINFLLDPDEVHILNIAIREDFRMQGIASKLMEEMIKISYNQGVFFATLEVRRNNAAARKLYEKFGFAVTEIRPFYYSDTGESALIMEADLRYSFNM